MSAASTRYAALVIAIPVIIFICWNLAARNQWLFLIFALIVALIPLLPDLLLNDQVLFLKFGNGNTFIDYGANAYSWSPLNFFRKNFFNTDGEQHYNQWNFFYSLFNIIHPAFLFAGILFLFFLRIKDFRSPLQKFFALIVLLYAGYLAGLQYQSTRYLLLSFPFVILVFFPAFLRCSEKFFRRKRELVLGISAVITLQLCLFLYSSKNIYELNQTEKQISQSLLKYPGETIYTTSINGALQSYGVKNQVIDLYSVKINRVEMPALLLYNEREFPDHFKNKNPMINFNFIRENYNLSALQTYAAGWQLFEIKN